MDCLFCKIANKEISSLSVYEDESTLAFLDIHPHGPGHSVVVPKFHVETILELPGEQIEPLFSAVKKVVALLKERLASDGFTIGINHGRVGGQAVDHLHIHIIPRYKDDGGGSIHSVVKNMPLESLEAIHNKITQVKHAGS